MLFFGLKTGFKIFLKIMQQIEFCFSALDISFDTKHRKILVIIKTEVTKIGINVSTT